MPTLPRPGANSGQSFVPVSPKYTFGPFGSTRRLEREKLMTAAWRTQGIMGASDKPFEVSPVNDLPRLRVMNRRLGTGALFAPSETRIVTETHASASWQNALASMPASSADGVGELVSWHRTPP